MGSMFDMKVVEPLVLTNSGVEKYMSVQGSIGNARIIPVANLSGLYAQMNAKPGESVVIDTIGKATGGAFWAHLLTSQRTQYGYGADYSNPDSGVQMLYLGIDAEFARTSEPNRDLHKANRSTFQVNLFGRILNIRYVGKVFGENAELSELRTYQGFFARTAVSDNIIYKLWMRLTKDGLMKAISDPQYNELGNLVAGRWSFSKSGEPFKFSDLELLLTGQKKAEAKSDNGIITIYSADGQNSARIEIGAGMYSVQAFLEDKARQVLAGRTHRERDVLAEVALHIKNNNPVLIGGKPYSKTQMLTVYHGGQYEMRIAQQQTARIQEQPKQVPPQPVRTNVPDASGAQTATVTRQLLEPQIVPPIAPPTDALIAKAPKPVVPPIIQPPKVAATPAPAHAAKDVTSKGQRDESIAHLRKAANNG